MSIPPSASGVENQDRPDVTGSGEHMDKGDTEDDLLVRGCLERSPSGQPVFLHLRRQKARGDGTTGGSANRRERPHAGPTAEAHTDTPLQPMADESKKRKQAPDVDQAGATSRVVLINAQEAEAEVQNRREQSEEEQRAMKRRKLIPGSIKPGPAGDQFKVFLKADAEMH